MKKLVTVLAVAFFAVSVSAQTTPAAPAKKDDKAAAPAKTAPAKKDDKKAAAKKEDKKATTPAPAAK